MPQQQPNFIMSIVPLLVTAHSTLGFVFGLQIGRPGWHSALQAPAFVLLAGVSGVGLLLVLAAVVRGALGEHVFDHFVAAKRGEWDDYRTQVTEWEIDRYLDAF